jgi:hypothetical protein
LPTIIDSLILELQLDPAKFQKGQKDATEAFVKTKEEALKSGKGIEESSDKAAQALAKVARQALELYAVFLGGRGVKQFIEDITAGDAALGRFSGSLSESPQTIAAWGLAVERVGGSSAATSASFQSLSDKIEDLRLRGKALPDVFYQLQAAGGRTIDLNHGVSKSMVDIAANLKAVAAHDQAKASWLGRQLGIDPDTVNMMIKYGAGIGAEIERLKKLGPSSKDIAAAQDLQKAWNELEQEAVHFGRAIWTSLSPALINAMERFDAWLGKKENQEKFNAVIKQLSDWIDGIDWDKTVKGVDDFTTSANKAADSVGGWVKIGEALFGVWAVSKIAGIVTGIWGMVTALRAAAAAAAALALNPIIAGAIAAGAVLKPTPLNNGENELERQKKYGRDKHDAPGAEPPKSKGIWERLNELFGVSGAHAEGVQMEGRPVGRGNPLPVILTNGGGDQSFGKGVNGSTGPGGGGGASGPGGGGGASGPGGGGGASGPGGGGGSSPGAGGGRDYGKGDGLTPEQGAALLRSEGATPDEAAFIGAHMGGESRGHAGAHNFSGRDLSYGLWQINMIGGMGPQRRKMWGLKSNEDLYDPHVNAKAAIALYRDWVRRGKRGPSPWAGSDRFLNPSYSERAAKAAREWKPGGAPVKPPVPSVTPSPSVTNSSSTRTSSSSSSTETHIGSITVQTQATDAAGIAKELPKAIERSSFASQANQGPE